MSRWILTLALLVPAAGQASDLDAALARMAASTGAAYTSARARALTFDEGELRARVAAAAWSADSWQLDAMAAVALAWAVDPERCARVYELDGLTPARYLARRRAGPEVGRELRRLSDVAPVYYEALTRSLHRFSSIEDFPERYRAEADNLIAAERAALRIGLLAALGRSQHPVAPWALTPVALDHAAPEPHRRAAAIALGEVAALGGPEVVTHLAVLATSPDLSPWLRGGAVIGIAKAARAQPRTSIDTLQRFLSVPILRRAAISGLAIAGSSWAAESSPTDDRLRAEIAVLLVAELSSDAAGERALIEALAVVGHRAALAPLELLRRDSRPAVRARAERAWPRLQRALTIPEGG